MTLICAAQVKGATTRTSFKGRWNTISICFSSCYSFPSWLRSPMTPAKCRLGIKGWIVYYASSRCSGEYAITIIEDENAHTSALRLWWTLDYNLGSWLRWKTWGWETDDEQISASKNLVKSWMNVNGRRTVNSEIVPCILINKLLHQNTDVFWPSSFIDG